MTHLPCGDRTRHLLRTMPRPMRDSLHQHLDRQVYEEPGTPWSEVCAALALDILAANHEDDQLAADIG